MKTTDTSERGLERLICTALTGHGCDPPQTGVDQVDGYRWLGGNPSHYDREYCVDLVQLTTFLRATQEEVADTLSLDEDNPTRRKFLARLQGEISKRGTIDVLRHGIKHGAHDIVLFFWHALGRESKSQGPLCSKSILARSPIPL